MDGNERTDQTGVVFDELRAHDARALGRLFSEDMTDLGVEVTRDELAVLAERVIEASRREPPTCFCRVARPEEGAEPCGVVLANVHWSLKFAGRSLWIEELYVTRAYRRRGIGRRLVELVVDYGRERGFDGIDLEAYQDNTPASVLYRTMGFHRLGRQRFYYRFGARKFL